MREGLRTTLSCSVVTTGCSSGTSTLLFWRAGGRYVARCYDSLRCYGTADNSISVSLSSRGTSTLTIYSVSRTYPFNMEGQWACVSCTGDLFTACHKLEVYCKFNFFALFLTDFCIFLSMLLFRLHC